jgi:hypothetical protein
VNDIRDDDLGLSCLPLLTRRRRRGVESSSPTAALPPTQHRYDLQDWAAPAMSTGLIGLWNAI